MTPDKLYEMGYADGVNGVASNASHAHNENYEMGFVDGKGDLEAGVKATGTASPFIADDFTNHREAPKGYMFTDEYRTPQKFEIYLTKNGNAGVAKTDPKNARMRHILRAEVECSSSSGTVWCRFSQGHSGLCSHGLVKRAS